MKMKEMTRRAREIKNNLDFLRGLVSTLQEEYDLLEMEIMSLAYDAKELVTREGLSWELASEMVERCQDPYDILQTYWAFQNGCLKEDTGHPFLSESTLIKLASVAGGYKPTKEGYIRAIMDREGL